uniref:Transmembrane protein n=1 Tax=Romanomermis culicivorax TaxID=13658 RepID=A0A915K1K4_ROMCU
MEKTKVMKWWETIKGNHVKILVGTKRNVIPRQTLSVNLRSNLTLGEGSFLSTSPTSTAASFPKFVLLFLGTIIYFYSRIKWRPLTKEKRIKQSHLPRKAPAFLDVVI